MEDSELFSKLYGRGQIPLSISLDRFPRIIGVNLGILQNIIENGTEHMISAVSLAVLTLLEKTIIYSLRMRCVAHA